MENHITMVVCPNCGAKTTDHQNCEYCGSLFVRFGANKTDIARSYCSNEKFIYPTLEKALELNCKLQYSHEEVVTDVYFGTRNDKDEVVWDTLAVIQSNRIGNNSELFFPNAVDGRLAICFCCNFKIGAEFNAEEKVRARMLKFESLSCNSLFKRKSFTQDGYRIHVFYIDFGNDYKGAAAIVTEIMTGVYELPKDYMPLIVTNVESSVKTCDTFGNPIPTHVDIMRDNIVKYWDKYGNYFWVDHKKVLDLSKIADYYIDKDGEVLYWGNKNKVYKESKQELNAGSSEESLLVIGIVLFIIFVFFILVISL